MPNEKALWGSTQIFPVPVVAAVYRWLRGCHILNLKESNGVIQMMQSIKSLLITTEKSIKTNTDLIYTAVWGWELQNTLKRRVIKRMLSQYQLNINHIQLISNKQSKSLKTLKDYMKIIWLHYWLNSNLIYINGGFSICLWLAEWTVLKGQFFQDTYIYFSSSPSSYPNLFSTN